MAKSLLVRLATTVTLCSILVSAETDEESCNSCCYTQFSGAVDPLLCRIGCTIDAENECSIIGQGTSQVLACEYGKHWGTGEAYLLTKCVEGEIVEVEQSGIENEAATGSISAFVSSTTGLAVVSVGSAACIAALAVVYRVHKKSSTGRKSPRSKKADKKVSSKKTVADAAMEGDLDTSLDIVDLDEDTEHEYHEKGFRNDWVLKMLRESRDSDSDDDMGVGSVIVQKEVKYEEKDWMKDPDAIDDHI